MTEERLNAVKESINLKLTEWEFDVICQVVMSVQSFPATHVDIANKLIQKLKERHKKMLADKETDNGNSK
jgi:hypothetical protein